MRHQVFVVLLFDSFDLTAVCTTYVLHNYLPTGRWSGDYEYLTVRTYVHSTVQYSKYSVSNLISRTNDPKSRETGGTSTCCLHFELCLSLMADGTRALTARRSSPGSNSLTLSSLTQQVLYTKSSCTTHITSLSLTTTLHPQHSNRFNCGHPFTLLLDLRHGRNSQKR